MRGASSRRPSRCPGSRPRCVFGSVYREDVLEQALWLRDPQAVTVDAGPVTLERTVSAGPMRGPVSVFAAKVPGVAEAESSQRVMCQNGKSG